jgi:hypothetical protein
MQMGKGFYAFDEEKRVLYSKRKYVSIVQYEYDIFCKYEFVILWCNPAPSNINSDD